ncbi:MAG: tRNA uridine-5-carboxymethylaminomethyl(34) synthesis GTPase MnmE [Chlamydiota bacterium]|jgi:tRNA modification GTPase
MFNKDTIAAIATPYAESAIAILRISGNKAVPIVNQIFSKDLTTLKSHTAHYGKIFDENNHVIDHVLLLFMKGPRSYTGEDTIEIQCHGSTFIAKTILQTLINKGARLAEPGEFTYRAYKNNKIDLVQAEAVQSLISAKNKTATKAAQEQLEGSLSSVITSFQKELTDIAAVLEAWVDFPEEDLAFESFTSILNRLQKTKEKMVYLSNTFDEGKKLSEGVKICIAGPPNAGKSTLMNFLLQKERAIVSDIAGTTRDTIEEQVHLEGMQLNLIDTAGIRETDEVIEKIGIEKTKQAMQEADFTIYMAEANNIPESDILNLLDPQKTLLVINKIDISHPRSINFPHYVEISLKNQWGIESFKEKLKHLLTVNKIDKEEIVLTKLRHKNALDKSIEFLDKVYAGLKNNISAEFVTFDMRETLYSLSQIIGVDVTEEILTSIFSKFCLGK